MPVEYGIYATRNGINSVLQNGYTITWTTLPNEVPEALSFLVKKGKPSQEVDEIEGLLVLGLWASFERFLRDYLQEKGTVLKQYLQPLPFADSLYEHFSKNVERWEPRDILNFLKDSLFTTPTLQALIDKAQHILTHRHRVAHANPNRRNSKYVLKDVYETLNEIINRLLQY